MKLYYSPGACSLAPHILLHELGVPCKLVRVDTSSHKTEHGDDFYRINPKGHVPTLVLPNGEVLTEGPIIAQWVGDQAAANHVVPAAGSLARYRLQEWQNYITSELHKSFSPLFHTEFDATAKATMRGLLRKKFVWVNEQLQHRAFLLGEHFSAADAYLFVVSRWAGYVDLDLSGLDALHAFLQRVAERPAVRAAMKAEGLMA